LYRKSEQGIFVFASKAIPPEIKKEDYYYETSRQHQQYAEWKLGNKGNQQAMG